MPYATAYFVRLEKKNTNTSFGIAYFLSVSILYKHFYIGYIVECRYTHLVPNFNTGYYSLFQAIVKSST